MYVLWKSNNSSANDVGRGSFNFHRVKSEFFKSYNLLTAMMGSAHDDKNKKRSKKQRNNKITSILGFIISIKKEVMDQRECQEILWEEIERGEHPEAVPDVLPKVDQTRKRPAAQDYLFVAESSDEAVSSPNRPKKKKKKANRAVDRDLGA